MEGGGGPCAIGGGGGPCGKGQGVICRVNMRSLLVL